MCIDFRRDRPPQTDTVIHDNKLEVVEEYTYLGTTIDNKLSWDRHCIALHCIASHRIELHRIALQCIALHCIISARRVGVMVTVNVQS